MILNFSIRTQQLRETNDTVGAQRDTRGDRFFFVKKKNILFEFENDLFAIYIHGHLTFYSKIDELGFGKNLHFGCFFFTERTV